MSWRHILLPHRMLVATLGAWSMVPGTHELSLPVVHRSWDPPGHDLGERGPGGVAFGPQQGLHGHWLPEGQATIQKSASVHGNHTGTGSAPQPRAHLMGWRWGAVGFFDCLSPTYTPWMPAPARLWSLCPFFLT